jgi:hypothetical protein
MTLLFATYSVFILPRPYDIASFVAATLGLSATAVVAPRLAFRPRWVFPFLPLSKGGAPKSKGVPRQHRLLGFKRIDAEDFKIVMPMWVLVMTIYWQFISRSGPGELNIVDIAWVVGSLPIISWFWNQAKTYLEAFSGHQAQ